MAREAGQVAGWLAGWLCTTIVGQERCNCQRSRLCTTIVVQERCNGQRSRAAGWLVGWLVGWLALVGWLGVYYNCTAGDMQWPEKQGSWLAGWLAVWLAGCVLQLYYRLRNSKADEWIRKTENGHINWGNHPSISGLIPIMSGTLFIPRSKNGIVAPFTYMDFA